MSGYGDDAGSSFDVGSSKEASVHDTTLFVSPTNFHMQAISELDLALADKRKSIAAEENEPKTAFFVGPQSAAETDLTEQKIPLAAVPTLSQNIAAAFEYSIYTESRFASYKTLTGKADKKFAFSTLQAKTTDAIKEEKQAFWKKEKPALEVGYNFIHECLLSIASDTENKLSLVDRAKRIFMAREVTGIYRGKLPQTMDCKKMDAFFSKCLALMSADQLREVRSWIEASQKELSAGTDVRAKISLYDGKGSLRQVDTTLGSLRSPVTKGVILPGSTTSASSKGATVFFAKDPTSPVPSLSNTSKSVSTSVPMSSAPQAGQQCILVPSPR